MEENETFDERPEAAGSVAELMRTTECVVFYKSQHTELLEKTAAMIPKKLAARLSPEDVLHEAFLRVLTHRETIRWNGEKSFCNLILTIARNYVAGLARRPLTAQVDRVREKQRELSLYKGLPAEPGDRIELLLDRLTDAELEVVRLRTEKSLSFVMIGRRLDVSPDAARMVFRRAARKLQTLARRLYSSWAGGARELKELPDD